MTDDPETCRDVAASYFRSCGVRFADVSCRYERPGIPREWQGPTSGRSGENGSEKATMPNDAPPYGRSIGLLLSRIHSPGPPGGRSLPVADPAFQHHGVDSTRSGSPSADSSRILPPSHRSHELPLPPCTHRRVRFSRPLPVRHRPAAGRGVGDGFPETPDPAGAGAADGTSVRRQRGVPTTDAGPGLGLDAAGGGSLRVLGSAKAFRQSRRGRPLRREVRGHARRQAEVGGRCARRPHADGGHPRRRQGGDEDVFQHPDR